MSVIDHMRGNLIKVRILRHIARRRGDCDIVDMTKAEPEKSLPDVPLHQRGFGVMDEPPA